MRGVYHNPRGGLSFDLNEAFRYSTRPIVFTGDRDLMTSAAVDTDIRDTFTAEELGTDKMVELRRLTHCSIEKRSQLEQLMSEFDSVAKKFSSENKAEVRRGTGQWILGRIEEAIQTLAPARQSKERAYVLGQSYLEVGRTGEALTHLKEAVESDSEDGHAKLAYLETRIKAGLHEEAEKQIDQMAKKFAASAEYHYLRGLASDMQGYYADALEAYEKALELEPGHARALFRIAHSLDLHGDDAAAIERYEQLRNLRPCHVNTMINLGTIYEDRGEYDKATECYKAILEYFPNHPRAKLYYKDSVASSSMFYDEDAARREQKVQQILSQPVAEISCSPRVRAALQRLGVNTLGDLAQKSEEDLLGLPNFGRTSLREVKEILATRGLSMRAGDGAAVEGGEAAPTAAPAGAPSEESLRKNLSEFEWSGRIRKVFERLNVVSVGDLLKMTEADLLKNKNLGMTSIKEIRKKLGQLGVAMREE